MTPLEVHPAEKQHYTPVETRILKELSDGEAHLATELCLCLPDAFTHRKTLSVHIYNIRQKLPKGEYIVCEWSFMKVYYRHVVLLVPRDESKKTPLQDKNGRYE